MIVPSPTQTSELVLLRLGMNATADTDLASSETDLDIRAQ